MSTELVPLENPAPSPADLSTPELVQSYLSQLLPATRGEGKGTLAGALVPWICDKLPSTNSRQAYGRDLRDFLAHMELQGIEPTAVAGDDLRMYKEALRKSGQASATIARKLSVIRGTYEQWGKKGFVDWHTVQDIQAAESPRVEKNSTPGLTQSEASKLLHAPDTTSRLGIRDHALLFVFFRTACRVSAIAGALVGHVERTDADWYLRVTEKGDKKSRKVLLEAAPPLLRYMEAAAILEDREGPLFRPMAKSRKGFDRRHLDRKDILDIVKKYARQAGIDVDRIDSRGVGVHSLRKTTITNALNNGAPMHQVQELAGHCDIRTTQGYYMKKDADAEAAARHIQIR
jgi:site-specific recombinase XerD